MFSYTSASIESPWRRRHTDDVIASQLIRISFADGVEWSLTAVTWYMFKLLSEKFEMYRKMESNIITRCSSVLSFQIL